ncbi:MAG: DUF333 domain-containing protein [Candidatus Micrarchaeota archaeon]
MKKLLLIALFAFALAGCVQQATPSPSPTPLPTALQQASPSPSVQIANPASVHCVQFGGTVDIRTDATGGEYGVCVFANGSECEEWALFRGEACAPSPTLEPNPEPTATPQPTVEPTAAPAYCLVSAIPSEGTKYVYSEVIANFFGLAPMPRFATVSCEYSNESQTVPISNTTAKGYCPFHLKNNSLTIAYATAAAEGVSCTAAVTVRAPAFVNCSGEYALCLTREESIRRVCVASVNATEECGYYEGESLKCYSCMS